MNINDFCNACGDCTTFCMHEGRPWYDKPRLFLNEGDFLNVDHNGYRIDGRTRIRHRSENGDEVAADPRATGTWCSRTTRCAVTLGKDYAVQSMELKQPFEGTLSLREAAAMHVVLEGISESLPHLILE